jgi:hypothetical protein
MRPKTTRPMPNFERFEVVRVLFPLTDRQAEKNRPAPSIVRFKLLTFDHRLVRGKLGRLAEKDRVRLQKAMRTLLP